MEKQPAYNPNEPPPYPGTQPGYPPPAGAGYPPPAGAGYPPPAGAAYPPPAGTYQPPAGQTYPPPAQGYPAGTQQYPQTTTNTVVIPSTVVVAGNCPRCQTGVIVEDFTCCGIVLAILFFPLGLLCCFLMRERHCSNCRATF